MAKQLNKGILREIVKDEQPVKIKDITEELGDDFDFHGDYLKGLLADMVHRGQLVLVKGDYTLPLRQPSSAAPTKLFKVVADNNAFEEQDYDKEKEGIDGWKRTQLAAVKEAKRVLYAAYWQRLELLRALHATVAPVKTEEEEASEEAA